MIPGFVRLRALWSERHRFGTKWTRTREQLIGIVSREGGGTRTPTLGGGTGVTRARGTPTGLAL